MGSVQRRRWCSSQEEPYGLGSSKYKWCVLHLSNDLFVEDDSVVEGAENDLFLPMCPDSTSGKILGSCFSDVATIRCDNSRLANLLALVHISRR